MERLINRIASTSLLKFRMLFNKDYSSLIVSWN
jgi:hypothetical protein